MFAQVLATIFSWKALLSIIGGVAAGISIGAMPGLTSTMGIALLMPLTFTMDSVSGLMVLIGEFCGAIYGGSITAILINTPGTPSAAATVLDGYPMTMKGQSARALGISTISSFLGGIISGFFLILVAPRLASVALRFSAPEMFALAVFGLSIISSISGKSVLKGVMSGLFGIILSLIGIDNITGYTRFAFGSVFLMKGLSFIPVMVGLFAMSQCFITIEDLHSQTKITTKIQRSLPSRDDLKRVVPVALRNGIIGTLIGVIPGAGGDISAFVSYDMEKRLSKHPEEFGKGAPEGVAAPEASNNGTTGGALIPLLTLGIPGDNNTAVMLGALMMHNLVPGPQLFVDQPVVVHSLFLGFILANICMLVMGLCGIRIFTKIVQIPKIILTPIIMVMCTVGSFSINNSFLDIVVMFIFGLIGYAMIKGGYPLAPVVLALILGPMAEGNFRRSLVMSQGSYSIFFTHPICFIFLVIAVISFVLPLIKQHREAKRIA